MQAVPRVYLGKLFRTVQLTLVLHIFGNLLIRKLLYDQQSQVSEAEEPTMRILIVSVLDLVSFP